MQRYTKKFAQTNTLTFFNYLFDFCDENDIKLLYYSNLGIEYPYKIFENKELLIKEIRGTNG